MTTALTKLPGNGFPVVEGSLATVGYDERRLQHIAREIAMDILELPVILAANQMSEQEWEAIAASPAFKALLAREEERWNSTLSTAERTRFKALALVEDSLVAAAKVINDPQEGAQGRARMLEAVAKIANIGEKPAGGGAEGNRVMIQINMGNDKVTHDVTPQVTVVEAQPEEVDG